MKNKLLLLATALLVTSTVFGQIQKKALVATRVNAIGQFTSANAMNPNVITCDTAYSLFPDVYPGDTSGVIYTFVAPAKGYAFGTNSYKFTSCAETYDWSINKLKCNGATLFFDVAKFKSGHGTDTIAIRLFKTNKGGSAPKGLGLTEKSVTLSAIKANITAGNFTKVKFPKAVVMDTTHTWMINFTYKATGGDSIAMVTGLFRGELAPFGYTNTWVKYPAVGTTQTWYSSSDTFAFQDGISMWVGAWVCTPNMLGPATETIVYNSGLDVTAYPNPSSSTFKLNIQSPKSDPISVRVMDVTGRQIAVYNNVANRQIFEFGNNLKSGMYLVQVIQGSTIKSFKLNKS